MLEGLITVQKEVAPPWGQVRSEGCEGLFIPLGLEVPDLWYIGMLPSLFLEKGESSAYPQPVTMTPLPQAPLQTQQYWPTWIDICCLSGTPLK